MTLKPILSVNDTRSMINIGLLGLGFIFTHENLVASYLKEKTLIPLFEKATGQPINIYAYYEGGYGSEPKIRAFMDCFV